MTTPTPTLEDQRVSLTPAGYAAGREQDACAVLCAMLTNPQSGAHYRALRRACQNVTSEDVITTARLLGIAQAHRIYLSADLLSLRLVQMLACELDEPGRRPLGYAPDELGIYAMRLHDRSAESWAALYELATAALVWDRSGALAF